jgi:hypothetical protein
MFVDPCDIENPTSRDNVSKFYFIFIWSSTSFGRHTAHHQEPKTALAASGFAYVEGRGTCSCWPHDSVQQLHVQQPSTYAKPEAASAVLDSWWWAVCVVGGHCPLTTRPTTFHVWKTRGCQCSFRLLMMGDVSPETCWASYKYGIIKFWYIVASCWIYLYELYYDAWIHERQVNNWETTLLWVL